MTGARRSRHVPRNEAAASTALEDARPTREEAFEAFCTLLAFVTRTRGSQAPTYSADDLPPGITRDAFLRRHRDRLRAGVAGWTKVGGSRVVTSEAWELEVASETATARSRPKRVAPNTPPPEVANDIDAELDAALGIRSRRTAT